MPQLFGQKKYPRSFSNLENKFANRYKERIKQYQAKNVSNIDLFLEDYMTSEQLEDLHFHKVGSKSYFKGPRAFEYDFSKRMYKRRK